LIRAGVKTFFINLASLFSANTISSAVSFVSAVLLARYLAAEKFGLYGAVLFFVGLGNQLSAFGINRLLIRDLAQRRELTQQYLDQILGLRIILAGASMLILYFYISTFETNPALIALAPIALLTTLPYSASFTFDGVLKAHERMKLSALCTGLFEISRLLLLLGVIYFDLGLSGVLWVLFAAYFIYALATARALHTLNISLRLIVDLVHWRSILKLSFPFAVLTLLEVIHGRMDTYLLNRLCPADPGQAGAYFAAYRMMEAVLILPAVVQVILLPRFSRRFLESAQSIKKDYHRFLALLVLSGAVICGLVWLFAPFAIHLFFGAQYDVSGSLLRILIVSCFFFFVHYANVAFLSASRIQWKILVFSVIQVSVNLFGNLYAIPRWGAVGAAWINNLSTCIGFIMFTTLVHLHLRDLKREQNEKT
jgi:O-antigen/teichoic acid export membrane protein